jgi:hypothetical protein
MVIPRVEVPVCIRADVGSDAVGANSRHGRDVVVIPAVLVESEDEDRRGPFRAAHDGADDLIGVVGAALGVLRVLLGSFEAFWVHEAERRERTGGAVGEEVLHVDDLARVLLDDVRKQPSGRQVDEVVLPGDPVGVEHVEDRAEAGLTWTG